MDMEPATRYEACIDRMEEYLEAPNGQDDLIEVLENLGGVRVGRNWSRKTMGFGMKTSISEEIEKDMVVKDLPSNYKKLLKRFTEELVINRSRKKLEELMTARGTSIIQHLLFVLKVRSTDLCDDVVKRCVEIIFSGDDSTTKAIVTNSVSAYLVETIILVASESRLKKIWTKYLKGKLKSMWEHDIANFIVQRLIDAAQTEELFNEITAEIYPKLDEIFSFNRPGIGVCLAKACIKFPAAQEKFIEALTAAHYLFEAKRKEYLVSVMLFRNISKNRSQPRQVWLHGSLMLQYIFKYRNTYDVSKSFLLLDVDETIAVALDKSGSHVVESFLQSETVPTVSKNEFVHKLMGHYMTLQQEKPGKRIVDYLMSDGDDALKEKIIEEICRPGPIGSMGPRRYPSSSQPRPIGDRDPRHDHHHHQYQSHHHHHSSINSSNMGSNSYVPRKPANYHPHGQGHAHGYGYGHGHGHNGMSGGSSGSWRPDLKRHHNHRDIDDYKDRPTKRSHSSYYRQKDDYSTKTYRD